MISYSQRVLARIEDGEWMEECAVGVLEESTQSDAAFLGLEDGAEGVDVQDVVCCCQGAVE